MNLTERNLQPKLSTLRTFDTLITENESAVTKKMREKLIILNSGSTQSIKRSTQNLRDSKQHNWSNTELHDKQRSSFTLFKQRTYSKNS